MKNNKSKTNTLPKGTKFLKFNSENEADIRLEFLIANLIHEGASFNALTKPIDLMENKKDKEVMRTKITNITLDFINRNPKSAEVLRQNNKAHEFLNSLGLDFYH
ncbi:hypothetical protein ACM55I_14460 [Flavobacterium sp. GB2R13]|uniref:hypothetical protein n=1 Tax=Flavobacterium algoris TaxID=3398733 RepID=UPI003A87646A